IASPGNASNQNQTPVCITPTADLFIFCDGSTPTTASLDFNNAGQAQFHYSYTVDGGPPVTGTFNAPSNYTVTGLTPGQQVEFTLTWIGLCGNNTRVMTCSSSCITTTPPNFAPIAPICAGSVAP